MAATAPSETLISGTSTERKLRSAIMLTLTLIAAAYFLYDGTIGYPRENVREALVKVMGQAPGSLLPTPNEELTAGAAQSVIERIAGERVTLSEVTSRWGSPAARSEDRALFLGTGGYVLAETRGDPPVVVAAEWTDGPKHSAAELMSQKLIGAVLAVVAIGLLLNLCRVFATRATLTHDELCIPRFRPIPLHAVESINPPTTPNQPEREIELVVNRGGKTQNVLVERYFVRDLPRFAERLRAYVRSRQNADETAKD